MATIQPIKIDPDAVRAINRLAKAIEHSNQLKIETERARRNIEPVKVPHNEELDAQIMRESGIDLDRKMLEDAVAEGDDTSVLEEKPRDTGFRSIGYDAGLGERMGHPGGTYG